MPLYLMVVCLFCFFISKTKVISLAFVPVEGVREQDNRAHLLRFREFKTQLYFFSLSLRISLPPGTFSVLPVESFVNTHVLELLWLPCFRLSSAYCRTNVCIFLLRGSFHWHIPRQWNELTVRVASPLCTMSAYSFKSCFGVNAQLINFLSAEFNLAYLLFGIVSLSLLFIIFHSLFTNKSSH